MEIQHGDSVALSELYRRYVTLIYRYIRKRVASTEVAEDITSDVFLAVIQRISKFRGDASVRTWLFGIARRRVADHWRKAYQLPESAIDTVDLLLHVSEAEEGQEDDSAPQRLHSVLNALPEKYRKVLECRFLEGKTVRETAEHLSLTESNVKVIQHRAIAMASKHL